DKNGFILNHGGFKCRKAFLPWSDKITFDDVCSDAYSFLDANPSETIIFAIKLENSSDDVATCQQLIMDTINKNPDKWYTRNAIPTLGEVRGKIVLAIRYDDVLKVGEEKSGLHLYWEDQGNTDVVEVPYAQTMLNSNNESLWVQDRYKYTIEDKYAAFEEGLDNCLANDDTFFINFLSLSGQNVLPHPKGNANSLNKKFGYKKLQKGTCYGIIIVDRANTEMASKIFETNL
ncbi:MAG: phosphatidylinositol-specific phospholipase C domain-containing protein, partial [Lachnospiraceae bacterium]|nr:phosphatidylinositol-specific phospholipase C domain-containing protein [Lachnospiraceae bacterium]